MGPRQIGVDDHDVGRSFCPVGEDDAVCFPGRVDSDVGHGVGEVKVRGVGGGDVDQGLNDLRA